MPFVHRCPQSISLYLVCLYQDFSIMYENRHHAIDEVRQECLLMVFFLPVVNGLLIFLCDANVLMTGIMYS